MELVNPCLHRSIPSQPDESVFNETEPWALFRDHARIAIGNFRTIKGSQRFGDEKLVHQLYQLVFHYVESPPREHKKYRIVNAKVHFLLTDEERTHVQDLLGSEEDIFS